MACLRSILLAVAVASTVSGQILTTSNVLVSSTDGANAASSTSSSDAETSSPVDDSAATSSADAETFSILNDSVTASPVDLVGTPLAGAASPAMSSVTSIYFPGADPLPYVASLIGQNNGVQTLAISCGPGVNADTCGFPSSVTVTAGPSTAYVSVSNGEATFVYDCKISDLTTAICAETFNGNAAYIQTSAGASTVTTSSVTTETLASTDLTWMPITITAGGGAGAAATATATATGSVAAGWSNLGGSTSTPTGSTSTATTSTGTASTSTTATQATGTGAAWSNVNNMGSTATVSIPSGTTATLSISSFMGAADRLTAVGSFAAGLLALAGLIGL